MERISKDIQTERVVSEIKEVENVLQKEIKQKNGQISAIVNVIFSAIISGMVATIPKLVFAFCEITWEESIVSVLGYIMQLLVFCLLIFAIPKFEKTKELTQNISRHLSNLEADKVVDASRFSIRQVTKDVRYHIFPLIVGAYDCATVAIEVSESKNCRIMNFMWGSEKLSKVISMLYVRRSTLEEIIMQYSCPKREDGNGPLSIVSVDTLSLYEIEQMLALVGETIELIQSKKQELVNKKFNMDFDIIQENYIGLFKKIEKDLHKEIEKKSM